MDLLVAWAAVHFFLAVLLAFLISGLCARGMLHAAWHGRDYHEQQSLYAAKDRLNSLLLI